MKKTPLRQVSDKQKAELTRRSRLKKQLILEYGEHCMTCKDINKDWRGISLSHIIPLSRGGVTSKDNCLLEDYNCHSRYEKKPELREQEHPELFKRLPYLVRTEIRHGLGLTTS